MKGDSRGVPGTAPAEADEASCNRCDWDGVAPWFRLGSAAGPFAGLGSKALLLDRAARAGLPVPAGYVLLDEAYRNAAEVGLVRPQGQGDEALLDEQLLAFLSLPALPDMLAVRSAFDAEDRRQESLAGAFHSRLRVRGGDPRSLAAALCAVWQSADRRAGARRRDVLLMEMVEARWAGVAFTERDHEDDRVNFVEGTAEGLVSGEVDGAALELPKLRAWEEPVGAGFHGRLQRLLRDVRRHFGEAEWDVEWADDGRVCWLLQVRPVTRALRRDEVFTLANHKEILPPLPSRFMTGVIASCAADLFQYYRGFDATLPAGRPFIEVFAGRPLINLSLLADLMRHLGLPVRLVTDSIGGGMEHPAPARLGRLLRKSPVLLRMFARQMGSPRASRETAARMLEWSEDTAGGYAGCVERLRRIYVALVHEMFSLTAAMSGPVALLRKLGVLERHQARQRTVSTEFYEALAEMGEDSSDDDWQRLLERFGHRGIYESDIARPRFHEAPELLRAAVAARAGRKVERRDEALGVAGWLTLPVWWQASRAMRAREELRHQAMRAFDRVRTRLLELASVAVRRGQLPQVAAIWEMEPEELCSLDEGAVFDADWLAKRRIEQQRLAGYHLPDQIRRFEDLEQYREDRPADRSAGYWPGLSLTAGVVEGRAWVLREPSSALPEGFIPERTILIARSVDAGWIPTFLRVAGVVAETGGDLSHGSIILREAGLPAITNVAKITSILRTGDAIRLRAAAGVVELAG